MTMTIEQAIKHCLDVRDEMMNGHAYYGIKGEKEKQTDCLECAKEHEQLAEWLMELKEWREIGQKCVEEGVCIPILTHGKYDFIPFDECIKRIKDKGDKQ